MRRTDTHEEDGYTRRRGTQGGGRCGSYAPEVRVYTDGEGLFTIKGHGVDTRRGEVYTDVGKVSPEKA